MLNKFFHRLKPFSAIRNRVYTGETRLRGLEIYHLLVEMVGAIRNRVYTGKTHLRGLEIYHLLVQMVGAIRNRVYTDETRLRGLGIYPLLVHEGGLCLCSREFYSPGLYSSFSVL